MITTVKTKKKIAVWIVGLVALLILSFSLGRCSAEGEEVLIPVKVLVPAISGTSEIIVKPDPIKPKAGGSILVDGKTIYTENPFNTEMAQEYIDLQYKYTGSELEVKRLNKVLGFLQENYYEIPIENEYLFTLNKIKVQGELLEFKQDFTRKEAEVDVLVPILKRTEFLVGAEVGNTIDFQKFVFKGNFIIQNKKGNQLNLSYDSEKRAWIGYAFKF
jgi:hypothetical protein